MPVALQDWCERGEPPVDTVVRADETIRRAIEIRDGHIQNPRILSFQQRAPAFPHEVLA